MSTVLSTGDTAPDFEAETYGGETVKLSDVYKKGNVALYFYPKDNTPGCTKEACSLRDGMDDLMAHGIRVLGVSTDGVKAHESFRNKYGLNFPLLSDKSKDIISLYGVKSAFGSAKRETFLINKKGEIVYIWKKVNTKKHADEILEKVKELGI
jgi:peroxiredoxin Q/BCP